VELEVRVMVVIQTPMVELARNLLLLQLREHLLDGIVVAVTVVKTSETKLLEMVAAAKVQVTLPGLAAHQVQPIQVAAVAVRVILEPFRGYRVVLAQL
jgi:hypothetical protein